MDGVLSIGLMLTGAAVALVAIGWFAGRVADEAVAVAAIVAGVALVGLAWLPRPAASPEPPAATEPLVLSPGLRPARRPAAAAARSRGGADRDRGDARRSRTTRCRGRTSPGSACRSTARSAPGDRDWFAIDVAPGTRGRLVASLVTEEASVTMTLVDDAGQVLGIARTIDEVRVRAATLERDLDRPRYHVLLMPGSDVPARYQLTLAARRW